MPFARRILRSTSRAGTLINGDLRHGFNLVVVLYLIYWLIELEVNDNTT